jgi:hypothetical protein
MYSLCLEDQHAGFLFAYICMLDTSPPIIAESMLAGSGPMVCVTGSLWRLQGQEKSESAAAQFRASLPVHVKAQTLHSMLCLSHSPAVV